MMEPKRKPTLADGFINHRYTANDKFRAGISLKTLGDLQLKVMKAAKYVFDDQASQRVGEVIRDIPDLIVREARFARAPYELTWIEWSSSIFWNTIYANEPHRKAQAAPDHAERVGAIIDGSDVYIIAGGTMEHPNRLDLCYATPYRYSLNIDPAIWEDVFALGHIKYPQEKLDYFMDAITGLLWGSTCNQIDREILHPLTKHFIVSGLNTHARQLKIMEECFGDLRDVIAVLLMLNRPSITHYKQTLPNSRGFLRNKTIAFMSHTSVTVSLDPKPILQLLGTPRESEVTKRWHKVEGHYCHSKIARDYMRIAGCIHDWTDTDADWIPLAGDYARSEVSHWVCKVCEGKRWWREYPHGRGDKTKGIVVKDQYNVVP